MQKKVYTFNVGHIYNKPSVLFGSNLKHKTLRQTQA